jgi:hypothetical protein
MDATIAANLQAENFVTVFGHFAFAEEGLTRFLTAQNRAMANAVLHRFEAPMVFSQRCFLCR